MVRFAARMQHDLTTFEQGLHGNQPAEAAFSTGVVLLAEIMTRTGLQFLNDMVAGKLPQPPICGTLGFHLAKVSDGYARFDGVPEFRHYNPIDTVHGGFAATLLDSALGCAILTTLAKGEAWTTLESKLNFVRPTSRDTGMVEVEGRIIHRGRTVATAEGTVKDRAGKLYAHASTMCMIFPPKNQCAATSAASRRKRHAKTYRPALCCPRCCGALDAS